MKFLFNGNEVNEDKELDGYAAIWSESEMRYDIYDPAKNHIGVRTTPELAYNLARLHFYKLKNMANENATVESIYQRMADSHNEMFKQSYVPDAVEPIQTELEQEILNMLGEASNKFRQLRVLHHADQDEFDRAIHAAQNIVLARFGLRATGVYRPEK